MCGMCPDVIGGCREIECGALPPVREDGGRRSHYMRWFELGEIPCAHVIGQHNEGCAVALGHLCSCFDNEDGE